MRLSSFRRTTPVRRTTRARRLALVAATVAVLILAACGDDGDAGGGGNGGATSTDPVELSSYESVSAMGEALADAGIECVLEYEGLEDAGAERSLCTIDGQQALLTVWDDPAEVEEFVRSDQASDRVAVGANWTVDLDDPATAQAVADALGGQLATD